MSDREDTVSLSPGPEPIRRPDHIEIGNSFDAIEVDDVLQSIAKTNKLSTTWESLQLILDTLISKQCKIMEEKVVDEAIRKEIDDLSMKIIHSIHDHKNCPFTIQRLCELLIEPTKYYTMYIKYLRAVEKVLAVTSYWEDYAIKDEPMDVTNESNREGLFPHSIDYIELVRHNFDIDDEEPKIDQESVETIKIETDEKQADKESVLVEKRPVLEVSKPLVDTEDIEVGLKSDQEKEKQDVKTDLDQEKAEQDAKMDLDQE